ncbi:MAG: peptide chain release factor-like protein [Candidatus Omnitrophica bacterium]|nr:peptide chain release factor-like protein [Candidatus Omnitrophota bacterium]MCB9721366.1 peptide chain release factor-like protein [Candidatus Omnitrophota bacterium]
MPSSFVQSQQDRELRRRMRQAGIYEKDLNETFIHSSGPGGQNVNKVATCVVLVHTPTAIQVKCQTARTQRQNRCLARDLLLEKILRRREEESRQARAREEKLKRQKRKRSKKSKEAMLEDKRRQGDKKKNRRKVGRERWQDD